LRSIQITIRSETPPSSTPWRTRSANLAVDDLRLTPWTVPTPLAPRWRLQQSRLVGRLSEIFRNPFAALFSRSDQVDRLSAYVIREHARGRPLAEILEDPYIRNRSTPEQRQRILDNPDVIRALGEDTVARAKEST
jgi:hypothetical protein